MNTASIIILICIAIALSALVAFAIVRRRPRVRNRVCRVRNDIHTVSQTIDSLNADGWRLIAVEPSRNWNILLFFETAER